MKNLNRFILLSAGLLLTLAGCQKGNETGGEGRYVRFGASSSTILTRTSYGADDNGYQLIEWNKGDQILVWSDYAINRAEQAGQSAVYSLDGITNSGHISTASSVNRSGEDGLVYLDDASKEYTFWGIYPYNAASATPTDKNVSFSIPNSQSCSGDPVTSSDGNVVENPNMNSAVMLARSDKVSKDQLVDLAFYPAFTAFEFIITEAADAKEDIEIKSVKLISSSTLYGNVTAALNENTATGRSYSGFPTADANKSLTYNFKSGTKLTVGKTFTFTVFALPQDIEGLSLEFTISDGTKRTASFKKNGEPITFGACKKYRLYTLAVPEENWHLYLETEVQEWLDEAKTINYGTADDNGAVISASALEFVDGVGSRTDRVEVILKATTTTDEETGQTSTTYSSLTAYYSVYSPTNGKWRITLKGANANHFTVSVHGEYTTGSITEGEGENATSYSYLENDVDGRIVFTVTPIATGDDAAQSGDSVELWFSVVVGDQEYNLHNEVTRDIRPLTVKMP